MASALETLGTTCYLLCLLCAVCALGTCCCCCCVCLLLCLFFFDPCWSVFQKNVCFFFFSSCRCVVGCWSVVLARSSSSGVPGNRRSCLYAGVYVWYAITPSTIRAQLSSVDYALGLSCFTLVRPLSHLEHAVCWTAHHSPSGVVLFSRCILKHQRKKKT